MRTIVFILARGEKSKAYTWQPISGQKSFTTVFVSIFHVDVARDHETHVITTWEKYTATKQQKKRVIWNRSK